jgi:hypothetical protein
MAWNPSPSVAVARDAAKRLGEIGGSTVNRCIVLYTLDNGRMGYASYGQTPFLCNGAKKLADVAYEAVEAFMAKETR